MKKCCDIDTLNGRLRQLPGKKIVFTNGVFDILHPGHIELLEFARGQGDSLVLGINDDESARRLEKGAERPVFSLAERMEVLAAVEYVDFIVPFSEDTPLELIRSIERIDVLVKGGDYLPHQVVGRKEVEEAGGRLLLFKFQSDYSTSSIIERIRQSI